MTTLSVNATRAFEPPPPLYNHLPIIADDIVFAGAACGDNGSGNIRPLVAGDPFRGFAVAKCDNTGGVASAKNVKIRTTGLVEIAVTGASAITDVGSVVYASDDDTFTLTAGGNSRIGTVHRWVSGTTCLVHFQARELLSPHQFVREAEAHTADHVLTAAESGSIHTNAGASGAVALTLPPATPGLEFFFQVLAAQELRIDPNGTETISDPADGVAASAGEYIVADAIGESLHIVCCVAGTWAVFGHTGTWTEATP